MLALLGAFGAALWLGTQPSGIGRFSCLRIRVGMSPEQVEAVLGCPPGDYRSEPRVICESWLHLPGQTRKDWYSDDGHVRVVFDVQRRVVGAYWLPRQETAIDRLAKWIGVGGVIP
jgi:hypothetical protein